MDLTEKIKNKTYSALSLFIFIRKEKGLYKMGDTKMCKDWGGTWKSILKKSIKQRLETSSP